MLELLTLLICAYCWNDYLGILFELSKVIMRPLARVRNPHQIATRDDISHTHWASVRILAFNIILPHLIVRSLTHGPTYNPRLRQHRCEQLLADVLRYHTALSIESPSMLLNAWSWSQLVLHDEYWKRVRQCLLPMCVLSE